MPNSGSFTAQTARIAAAKSVASRKAAAQRPFIPDPPATPPLPTVDQYASQILARTRLQLDLVAKGILDELSRPKPDSRRLRDLSDAQRHLAEQERILAGRPLPGSRRPREDRNPATAEPAWPVPTGPATQDVTHEPVQPTAIEPPPTQGISLPAEPVPTPSPPMIVNGDGGSLSTTPGSKSG
jgi:hypothetical protein